MKKTLLFSLIAVLVVILAIGIFSNTASASTTEFAGGSGTEADPYLISTKEHLNNIRNHLSSHFKMVADIVFTKEDFAEGGKFYNDGAGWEPIGSIYLPFSGSLNGEGKIINSINVSVNVSTSPYAGIFGYCDGASFKNLITANGEISIIGVNQKTIYCGGIVGCAKNCNFVKCHNGNDTTANSTISSGTIEPTVYTGGITGFGGTFDSCRNVGSISGTTSAYNSGYDYAYCGGITGQSSGLISACENAGEVSATSTSKSTTYQYTYAAGIVASTGGNVERCCNIGAISVTATNPQGTKGAGIAAFVSPSRIVSQCYNTGSVSSPYAGGIAGTVFAATISNCYNVGLITGESYAGGIVSYVTSNGEILNCYNVGNINRSDKYGYIGGITGYMSSGVSDNCYYIDSASYGTGRGKATTVKKTASEMQEIDTWIGFDFENIWEFKEKNLYLYPTLINNPYFEKDEDESNPRNEAIADAISETVLTTGTIGEEAVIIIPTSNSVAMTERELAAIFNDASITITSNNGIIGTGCKVTIGEYEVDLVIKGDIDGDGVATVFDALMVKKALADGSFENEALREFAGDVDGKSGTTNADVSALLSYIVGNMSLS